NPPAVLGSSRTARPTASAESPKKKTKKAPGVNASDASSASPSTSHSHHDIGRGVYSRTAAGSSREQPSILGAPTGPGQHTQQEDEPRYPEQVRPDRGGRHEEVETSGERDEGEARELTVRAVEHPRDFQQDDRRHHRRHARHTEEEAAGDPEGDADHRDHVRRDGRADEETGERPRQAAEEAVQVAVTRVL